MAARRMRFFIRCASYRQDWQRLTERNKYQALEGPLLNVCKLKRSQVQKASLLRQNGRTRRWESSVGCASATVENVLARPHSRQHDANMSIHHNIFGILASQLSFQMM
jgi:hypothetical protein